MTMTAGGLHDCDCRWTAEEDCMTVTEEDDCD